MGIYTEYLDKHLNPQQIQAERQNQLKELSVLRGGRDVLAIAADLSKSGAPIAIGYDDLLAVKDLLSNMSGHALDLILETPGGSGEVVEDIVEIIRSQYEEVGVIVPGYAKSAGTIMAMSADEILMGPGSGLGPIDGQILTPQGRAFSAHALLTRFERIKEETAKHGLNKAYIPMLQALSPGELEHAENAQKFSRSLVTKWLAKYKFRKWTVHSSSGVPVTEAERHQRAEEIAECLGNHSKWLTHGRSIRIADLQSMGLKVTDFSESRALADVIRRYEVLLRIAFESPVYKLFDTPTAGIVKALAQFGMPAQIAQPRQCVLVDHACDKCGRVVHLQANVGGPQPLQPGKIRFPENNTLKCLQCGADMDLKPCRLRLEAEFGAPIVGKPQEKKEEHSDAGSNIRRDPGTGTGRANRKR